MKHYLKNLFSLIFIAGLLSGCQFIPDDLLGHGPKPMKKDFGAFLTGSEEVPPVDAQGVGAATFQLSDDGKTLHFKLNVSTIEGVVAAHIHKGAFGENGPVVVPLMPDQDPSGTESGLLAEGMLTASDLTGELAGKTLLDLIKLMENNMAYVNIHTQQFPAGELRGQVSVIKSDAIGDLTTQLSGDEEVPPANTSATGVGVFNFNDNNTELGFIVNVSQLEDVRFAHIHIGKKGVNGPVVVTLKADKVEGPVNGLYAEGIITQADLTGLLMGGDMNILREAIRTGNAYVNVHTDDFPGGEIRGQL